MVEAQINFIFYTIVGCFQKQLIGQMVEFISKLITMLENHEEHIHWSEDGLQIIIQNPQIFSRDVLPLYFRHFRFQSFVRQLNMYNFHKICRKKTSVNFRNELFWRGNQQNYHLIKRRKKCGNNLVKNMQSDTDITHKLLHSMGATTELVSIFDNLLTFKNKFFQEIQDLKKMMECEFKEIGEKNIKILKPVFADIKYCIGSVEQQFSKVQAQIQEYQEFESNRDFKVYNKFQPEGDKKGPIFQEQHSQNFIYHIPSIIPSFQSFESVNNFMI